MKSNATIKSLVGWTLGALTSIQFYQFLRLVSGDTPYIGPAVQWLPVLLNKAFGLLAWLPLVLFITLLIYKEEYVNCSKEIVWSAVLWIFGMHVFMNVVEARERPSSTIFLGGSVYCIFAVTNIMLGRLGKDTTK